MTNLTDYPTPVLRGLRDVARHRLHVLKAEAAEDVREDATVELLAAINEALRERDPS